MRPLAATPLTSNPLLRRLTHMGYCLRPDAFRAEQAIYLGTPSRRSVLALRWPICHTLGRRWVSMGGVAALAGSEEWR